MRRPLSVVAVISVAAVLALSLSGCSGSPARTNTGGAHATSSSDVLAVWEQFATCARAHGVPNLPDPVPDLDGKARFPGFDGRSAARGEGLLSRLDMVRLVVGRRVGHAVAGEKTSRRRPARTAVPARDRGADVHGPRADQP